MKTTTNALVGWMAVALVLSVRTVTAGPLDGTSSTWLAAAVLGQSDPANNPPADPRQQSADFLRRARQAMTENDFVAADSLISQADGLGVKYNIFYQGDTPNKARRDLERKRNSASAAKPSGLFAPLGSSRSKRAPSSDPFAAHPMDSSMGAAAGQQVTPLPRIDSASPIGSRSADERSAMQASAGQFYPNTQSNAAARPTGTMGQGPNNSSNNPLRTARLALAFGDVRRAMEFTARARAMQINYQPLDDTPDKVEAAIRRQQEIQGLDKTTEAYARVCSRSLTEQADGLLRWGEYDEAERLANRAAALRIVYGPFEQKPQELIQRIANARRQNGNAVAAAPAVAGYASASSARPGIASRERAVQLVRQARDAIEAGQLDRAETLARQAQQMGLPEGAFSPGEDRPELVMLDLRTMRRNAPSAVMPAGGQYAAQPGAVTRALYDPSNDRTQNMAASNQDPAFNLNPQYAQNGSRYAQNPTNPARMPAPPRPEGVGAAQSQGMTLFQQGETALKAHDAARAYELFRQAANYPNDLDPATAQRLQDHLQLFSGPRTKPPLSPGQAPTMAGQAATQQQLLVRQIAAELAHRESNARAMRATDPKGSLAVLEEARKKVETAGLDTASRDQLLRSVDRAIAESKQAIEQNRPQIELADRNNRIRQDVERQQRIKVEVQEKVAMKIDLYNRLVDEQRFAEAVKVAKQAAELAPNDPVVVQVLCASKLIRNFQEAKEIQSAKEEGFVRTLNNVEIASEPFDDNQPIVFPCNGKDWGVFKNKRMKYAGNRARPKSEREIDIEKKLRTPVSLQFTNAPLSQVMGYLAKLADVNLHLDPKGLSEEGIPSDTLVTINLPSEIMLKSALNLILDPLHLSYVIKNEALVVTSEQMRDGQVYMRSYPVGDLIIPIPNFVATPTMGLAGAYTRGMADVSYFGGGLTGASSTATPLAVVSNNKRNNMATSAEMLAQQMGGGGNVSSLGGQKGASGNGAGPGGLGGGAQADFDPLIDLITTTVKPTSWADSGGGVGAIAPFESTLSLVITQTQDVHEEIVDLLEQLRRLQDLQVTIEVRFITLNDNFFERIGVSFDFDINDNIDGSNVAFGARSGNGTVSQPTAFNINQGVPRNVTDVDSNRTITVGMSSPNLFNADLDIPFSQNSFALAVPQFGGFDATAGAQLGFAILSDVEAFFFINAAQGDKRSNVLQAPKVTLFNGQQAYVSDTSQSPFVISVIPVVGDFAAAQQPVIVVLSEGTFMTVQAVVSNDRRFVRLTVVPFFSKIGAVNTFQFTGAQTTTTDTTREGLLSPVTNPSKTFNKNNDNKTTTNSGTTVQLPTFSYVTVTTTVSVPDGGTVLLGGIKRLSEGRNEFGVPLLNKLPYINRLFKNVGIGRETQSLMMMVTPRIIIQEEEEEKLGIEPQP